MSFGSFLGKSIGKLGTQMQEVQGYKNQYESWSDRELQREYKRLCSAGSGNEVRFRLMAVKMILSDRGYGQQ